MERTLWKKTYRELKSLILGESCIYNMCVHCDGGVRKLAKTVLGSENVLFLPTILNGIALINAVQCEIITILLFARRKKE